MNIKELFQHLAGHLKQDHEQIPDEVIQKFLGILEEVRLDEMPCSQVYARLDEYVEKEVHLDLCPDCCEEYETLLNVLEESSRRT